MQNRAAASGGDDSACYQATTVTLRVQTLERFVAGRTGLEPAASGVTGRRYNRLNYRPKLVRNGDTHDDEAMPR